MNIVFVLEHWGKGGTETYVERLGAKLIEIGHRVTLVLLGGREPSRQWSSETCLVLGSRRKQLKRLKSIVNQEDVGLVHLHLYVSMSIVSVYTKYSCDVPVVASWHLPLHVWNAMHKWLQVLALKCVDGAVGASELTARELSVYRGDVVAISPPITIPQSDMRPECSVAGNHIVGCGRMAAQKDWPTLLRALANLDKQGVEFLCTLIGGGELEDDYRSLSEELGLKDKVVFTGHVEPQLVAGLLSQADLFVLPSKFEGFGMAAVEAMALGIPTITSDFPASYEFLKEGETGTHFSVGDDKALAKRILWHLKHPEESQSLGLQGREFVVGNYEVEVIAKRHLTLYEKMITRR
ncbi:glycosyltransferase family 4 protein [Rubritalea tangerina]|uniref:Glycosyltransferase family 4 protein n=1 Tax=Rubritalea tangerina TaxID=430798 RepID=A0ABW4ZAR1_9BACT